VKKVTEVDAKGLDALLKEKKGLVVLDLWAPWCGPCLAIAPHVEKLAESHAKVTFAKLDIDKNDDVCARYGVRSVPTFLFFKGGKVVETITGADKASVTKALKAHGA
jgi:thioredoxin 1